MPSPKLAPLQLTPEERRVLRGWVRGRKTAQALALRARIVLACAGGGSVTAVATELGVSRDMVSKWRRRFLEQRLEGLADEPRPGRPRTVGDERIEQVVARTLQSPPPRGATHWSTRSMAKAMGMSQTTVSRIWRNLGLDPHQVETWRLYADPRFAARVRALVGLYLDPPQRALVLCVDADSPLRAVDRTAPPPPALPVPHPRTGRDLARPGAGGLLAALESAGAAAVTEPHRRHRHQEFLAFLKALDKAVPPELELHLVCGDHTAHAAPAVRGWLLRHPRFRPHTAPTGASWLTLVERWFPQQPAGLGPHRFPRHSPVTALERDVRAWNRARHTDPRPFVWTRTPDEVYGAPGVY
ncbi:IS630 family transposase [Streptomyces sp. 7R007]